MVPRRQRAKRYAAVSVVPRLGLGLGLGLGLAQRPGHQPLPRREAQLDLAHSARPHRPEGLRKRLARRRRRRRRLAACACACACACAAAAAATLHLAAQPFAAQPLAALAALAEQRGVAVKPARDQRCRRRRRLG